MRVLVLTLLLILAGRLATPSAAAAQYHRLSDAITVGATAASAGAGTGRYAGGPEIGGLIEVPIGDEFRLRGEGASGFWHFAGYDFDGVPGSAMQRHRFSLSVLRARTPPSPARRLSGYGGGGAGIVLYRFPHQPDGGAWGIHGVAGAEYLLPTMRSRWIAGAEVQLQAMGGPRDAYGALPIVSAHIAAVIKYRLP
jgi:hypothetical protein